ncbi:MAG: hypothetical protein ACRCTK_01920 [Alphaproteobacteria bacterium]
MNKNNKLILTLVLTIATTSIVFAMSGSDPATTPEDPTTKTITAAPAAEESKEESVTTTTPVSKPAAPSTPSVTPVDPEAEAAKAAYESKLSTAQAKLGETKIPATAKLKELNELKTQMAAKQKELLADNKAVQIANQKIVQIKAAETKRLQDVAKKTATAKAGTDFVEPTEDPALKTAYEAKLKEAGDALAKAKETVGTKTGELETIKDALAIKQTAYGITHKAVVAEQNKVAKIKADEVKRIQDVAKKAAAEKVAAQKAAALRVAQEKAAALKAEKDRIEAEKAAALQTKLEKELAETQKAEEALRAKIAEEEAAKQRIKEEEAKIAAAQRALDEAKKEAETKHAATEEAKKEKQESDAAEKQVKQNQPKKKSKK